MGAVFEDLTLEQMCDLMCGAPEDECVDCDEDDETIRRTEVELWQDREKI